ncbi:MAG: elongation factor G, partial [Candidatus Omnitrophica bacterium]|nr:elongation factor G [Candidatus Omnitrophota bacterium]
GHVDFTAEVERSLRVLDGAIGIFCATSGVQPQSETVWRQSERYGIPRLIYINKMDRVGADFFKVVKQIEQRLAAQPLILQLPIIKNESFVGIIDLIKEQALHYVGDNETDAKLAHIPPEYEQLASEYQVRLLEQLSEVDERILAKYLENQPITSHDIKAAVRQGTINCRFFPVFCGSSLKNKGPLLLLDAIVDYLPSPLDRKEIRGQHPRTGMPVSRMPLPDDPPSVFVFKVLHQPHMGKIYYGRIYSGKITKGDRLYNWSSGKNERIIRIFLIHAAKYEEVQEARAGDIVGLLGLKATRTADTLACEKNPVVFEKAVFPEPVLSVAIECSLKTDQEKLFQHLQHLVEEDPTIRLQVDPETGQVILSGMGELHLEVVIERLRRESGIVVNTGQPRVAYRYTIAKETKVETKFIKQTGGRGQYAHVLLKLEPLVRGTGFIFEDQVREGRIPAKFIPAVEKGIIEAMRTGHEGYEIVDIKAILLDGSYHEVDSSDIAFKIAGALALKEAFRKAEPVLLEPLMETEITVPTPYLGEVLADFTAREGKVEGMDSLGRFSTIKGLVPLRTIFGYTTVLRSITQGRAIHSFQPAHYQPVPQNLQTKGKD